MADQRIQSTEEMIGAGHATKADTLNRRGDVEHNPDGTHKKINTPEIAVSGSAPSTPVAKTLYEDSLIKAWARINVSGGVPSIVKAMNISSIIDEGVGDITVNFATDMANANYHAGGSTTQGGGVDVSWKAHAVGSVRLNTYTSTSAALIDRDLSFSIVGNN